MHEKYILQPIESNPGTGNSSLQVAYLQLILLYILI